MPRSSAWMSISIVNGYVEGRSPIRPPGKFTIDNADFTDLNVRPGQHTLTVILYTVHGTTTKEKQTIFIKGDDLPTNCALPTVRILRPTNNMELTSPTTIQVEATAKRASCGWR